LEKFIFHISYNFVQLPKRGNPLNILEIFENFNPSDITIKRPYIIAEAGVNHEGSMDTAKRLVREAKEGGADAIKFQTYRANTIASKDSPAYWDTTKEPTTSQYELFQKHDKFWKDEFVELKKYCDEVGIEFLSTPFDIESANFLNELMPIFKISSSDLTNKPFIQYIAEFKKPIILSTGASSLSEIHEAVQWIEEIGTPYALLHCVLNYPTPDENANLGMISGLKRSFPDVMVGYSDHTLPKDMTTLEVATMLGSVILEKHFTHDKTLQGNDHYHAMDMEDLKVFRKNLEDRLQLLGSFRVEALEDEAPARANARRSLVANRDIQKGKTISNEDLTFKRPAHGVSPKFIDEVAGKVALEDIAEDTVLQWRMFG
jgi:sialic acid synthase SpsE